MSVLEDNLAELDSTLASAIRSAPPLESEFLTTARNGTDINGVETPEGPRYFHSRYDPAREALRIVDQTSASCVVVMGAGMGYHVDHLLQSGRRVLLVDPEPSLLKRCLSSIAVSRALQTGALRIASSPEKMVATLLAWYVPALHGDLSTVQLPGRIQLAPAAFEPFTQSLNSARQSLESDVATQARFGITWARNLFNNLVYLAHTGSYLIQNHLQVQSTVLVVAAGPSLTDQMPWIRRNRDAVTIITTDTALPALVRSGITPDLAFSIDANSVSYLHVLSACDRSVPLGVELSCPPSVFQSSDAIVPLLTGNPLHTALRVCGIDLPVVDASTGTVTQAAVEFAVSLKPQSVVIAGADFSYPNGNTYARGTYLHDFFALGQSRTHSIEQQHYGFLSGRSGLYEIQGMAGVFSTPLLDSYRNQFIARSRFSSSNLYSLPGTGQKLPFPPPPSPIVNQKPIAQRIEVRIDRNSIKAALQCLQRALADLDIPRAVGTSAAVQRLDSTMLHSLVPIAYALARRNPGYRHSEALEASKLRLEDLISNAIARIHE